MSGVDILGVLATVAAFFMAIALFACLMNTKPKDSHDPWRLVLSVALFVLVTIAIWS